MGAAISQKLQEMSKHLLELSNIVATCEDWERRLEVVQAAPGETLDRLWQVPFDRVEVAGLSELEGLIEGLRERKEESEAKVIQMSKRRDSCMIAALTEFHCVLLHAQLPARLFSCP